MVATVIERGAELKSLERFISAADPQALFIHGVAGIGKSTLLRSISGLIAAEDGELVGLQAVFLGGVDLRYHTAAWQAIPALAKSLTVNDHLKFSRVWKTVSFLNARGIATASTESTAIVSKLIGVALDIGGLIPDHGFWFKIAKVSRDVFSILASPIISPEDWELIREPDESLLASLPDLFIEELLKATAGKSHKPSAVLVFDSSEAVTDSAVGESTWLYKLCDELTDNHISFVIAGRNRITWSPKSGRTEVMLLTGLNEIQAKELLEQSLLAEEIEGVPDDLIAAAAKICGESDGTFHTGALSYCSSTIVQYFNRHKKLPDKSIFETSLSGNVFDKVKAVYLQALDDERLKALLEVLALSPFFDEAYALHMDKELKIYCGQSGWLRLKQLIFLEQVNDSGFWKINATFQRALKNKPSVDVQRIHVLAEQYFSQPRQESNTSTYQALGWYHLWCLDAERCLFLMRELQQELNKAADVPSLIILRQAWEVIPIDHAPESISGAQALLLYADAMQQFADQGITL